MNLRLSRTATWWAVLVSLPLVSIASYMWLIAPGREWPERDELYGMADAIYLYLGAPLTHIIFAFRERGQLQDSDHWWALPLVNLLFIAQSIISAQAITLLLRLLDRLESLIKTKVGGV